MREFDLDVAILGAGTAGLAAYREARKYTDRLAVFDGGELGTTCARVGCMPSKLLIAAAEALHRAQHVERFGLSCGETSVDGHAVMERVRSERDRFVGFVLESIDEFDASHVVREHVRFVDDHTLETTGGRRMTARAIVIATGSRPAIPPPFEAAGDRLTTNDHVFDWDTLPESVAVFGAGVIGLELGQALNRLGVRTQLFGRDNFVGPLSDPVVLDYAGKTFGSEFSAHWHSETTISRDGDQVVVEWSGDPSGAERFDYLLAATGRRANVDDLGLENTSLELDQRGVPTYDPLSMRAGDSHVFIGGDAVVDLPLLHEAADEGRLAGENAARWPDAYRRARRTGLGIVFTDPQIGIAGRTYKDLTDAGIDFHVGEVSFEDQGRARVMGVNKGLLRIYGETETGLILGAEMMAPQAEHLSHLIAWSIQNNLTAHEMLQRPFYHPVLEEGLRTAVRGLNHALGFGPNPPLRCIDCGPGG